MTEKNNIRLNKIKENSNSNKIIKVIKTKEIEKEKEKEKKFSLAIRPEIIKDLSILGFDLNQVITTYREYKFKNIEEACSIMLKDPDTKKYNHRFIEYLLPKSEGKFQNQKKTKRNKYENQNNNDIDINIKIEIEENYSKYFYYNKCLICNGKPSEHIDFDFNEVKNNNENNENDENDKNDYDYEIEIKNKNENKFQVENLRKKIPRKNSFIDSILNSDSISNSKDIDNIKFSLKESKLKISKERRKSINPEITKYSFNDQESQNDQSESYLKNYSNTNTILDINYINNNINNSNNNNQYTKIEINKKKNKDQHHNQDMEIEKESNEIINENCNYINKCNNNNQYTKISLDLKLKLNSNLQSKLRIIKIPISKELEELFNDPNICRICFSVKINENNSVIFNCGNIFCMNCVTNYLMNQINDGKVKMINYF
jgi:hypothetical protein